MRVSERSLQEKKGGHEFEVRGQTIGTTGKGTLIGQDKGPDRVRQDEGKG